MLMVVVVDFVHISLQWTFYPNFGSDGPKTVNCVFSGIHIDDNRPAMLVEAVYVSTNTGQKEAVDDTSLRGLETLRQLPVAVRQFDIDGHLMDQNPEALKLFGPPKEEEEFMNRFEDRELGESVLAKVQEGNDYQFEAKQRTVDGSKWFSIKVRRTKDPVTSANVIIYSARDVSDIMRRAKEEADRINMERSEFFAVMAHEIRTPLHQVVGFVELLARTKLNGEQGDFVGMLQSSTHALMAIINDSLDFTKLEAGKFELESIPFEARAVIEGCMAAVFPQAEEKGLQISSDIARGIPVKLMGDPNRLRQILLNLVQNAVKFTLNGGIVIKAVRLEADKNGRVVLRFEVKDTGMGISPQHLSRIFNPYQQADSSVSRNFGGTGLGLAICDSLVNNLGGRIGVDSDLGKGTSFWFEIPFERHQKNVNDITSRMAEENPVEDVCGLRVLVAEDNKVNQKVVAAMLKRLGHFPTIVENGQLAVDEIEKNRHSYDLVLMDIQMPVMDVSFFVPTAVVCLQHMSG
jgi:signal transduction histidine kinase